MSDKKENPNDRFALPAAMEFAIGLYLIGLYLAEGALWRLFGGCACLGLSAYFAFRLFRKEVKNG